VLPAISDPISFGKFLEMPWAGHLLVMPHEKSTRVFPRPDNAAGIVLAIGPEGGFTEEEVTRAAERGFQAVSLGSRRLRAETAAAAALALAAIEVER
jgi:16S rRNA (uracil1498-N3)-methyltransferase